MNDIQRIRFLAANFSGLQGLQAIPISLLLILVVVWANAQRGPASDLTFPILASAGALALHWSITCYYRRQYGKVERNPRHKGLEYGLGVAGGMLGLAAFYLDIRSHLPISLVGLVFTIAILVEYVRMNLLVKGDYLLPQSLLSFIVLLAISILPLLGLDHWWEALGLRAQLYGVLVVVGVVGLISGLWTHGFLIKQLK